MSTRKLFLALAIVFAALSFSFKAKAQNEVPIYLGYIVSEGFNRVGFEVTLYNNDTHEYYYRTTSGATLTDYNYYYIGHAPAGNYTISIRMISWYYPDHYFGWTCQGQSGVNLYVNTVNETLLSDSLKLYDYGEVPGEPEGIELRIYG